MVWAVNRNQRADHRIRVVLEHPFTSNGYAQAVGNDVDPRRSSVRQYCPYKRAQQWNRGGSAVSDARLEGGIA